ncbi:MAG TPA: AAA family ATPase [Hypericibacter adhaerens]|jgi:NadR type nicotinamide-nucleotide adenylyltransferase|uniref:Transcriptional regulator NadR n=1 Tax=Hypericibacter adhaerens TaxID=2602016 RepID=A0A5J6MUW4_9PROT|nr:AAA family ATPase [Hypericibacter adhaerens]QEX20977.1 transcriptional regulator NadR [Hypericibacter adhaerens]HWA42211.1 AAA family ATPase [Hypericibacter adhaerens]
MPRGFIIGGFRLPTVGHKFLIEFASHWCQGDLDVMLNTRDEDAIPGAVRHRWLADQFRGLARIHRFHNALPEDSAAPDFWQLWNRAILKLLEGRAPELLFASESYGKRLAADLGARFIPVDAPRDAIPISASRVTAGIGEHWGLLLPEARPSFLKRVAIVGPESCGKTTFARRLAAVFRTVHVPEFARSYLEATDPSKYPDLADIEIIAKGHAASEDALARQANRLLVLDTDHVCTAVWSEVALGKVPPAVEAEIARRPYDLRLLMADDVPFTPDPLRYAGQSRQMTLAHFTDALDRRGLAYTIIDGGWTERTKKAAAAVDGLMAEPYRFHAVP